jgi:hypothetical protein
MTDPQRIGDEGGSIPIPPPDSEAGTPAVRWYTAVEIAASGSVEPAWIAKPYIAPGAITDLSAKVKLGKTRLIIDAIAAILKRASFLGQPTRKVSVVYLTEENAGTFRHAIARAGLLDSVELHVLLRHDARALSWPEVVAEAIKKCRSTGSELLVIDTLPDWADVRGDEENNAGRALEAMHPLRDATTENLAVVMLRHDRKSGGSVGDSSRGSSAFGGRADILISMKLADGKKRTTRRRLEGVSRYDGIPAVLMVDLKDGHYVAIGEGQDAVITEAATRIQAILEQDGGVLLVKELVTRLDGAVSATTVKRALKKLSDDGIVEVIPKQGKTKRASGYRSAKR